MSTMEESKKESSSSPFKVITEEEDLIKALDYKDLIAAVEKGLSTFSLRQDGDIVQPVRTVIHIPDSSG